MRIGICGNEKLIKDAICRNCKNEYKEWTFFVYTPSELLLDIDEGVFSCHLIFLDVSMKEFDVKKYNGIDVAKIINKKIPQCQIVYIVDDNEYYQDVYDTEHMYLIVKKNIDEKIFKVMSKAKENISTAFERNAIEIISGGNKIFIPREQIVYIERVGRKIELHTKQKSYMCYQSIKQILKKLDNRMVQIHSGAIINLLYVTYFGRDTVELSYNDTEIILPVGRTFMRTGRIAYNNYWKKDSD